MNLSSILRTSERPVVPPESPVKDGDTKSKPCYVCTKVVASGKQDTSGHMKIIQKAVEEAGLRI